MKTRSIAQGGVFTALSIVLLYLASFLDIASWSIAMLVGLIPIFFFLYGEPKTGELQFGATALISLMLLPNKEVAIMYAFLFGLYPILKLRLERRMKKAPALAVKLVFAEIWVAFVWKLISTGFLPEIPVLDNRVKILSIVIGAVLIVYYDFCLTKIFMGMRGILYRVSHRR